MPGFIEPVEELEARFDNGFDKLPFDKWHTFLYSGGKFTVSSF